MNITQIQKTQTNNIFIPRPKVQKTKSNKKIGDALLLAAGVLSITALGAAFFVNKKISINKIPCKEFLEFCSKMKNENYCASPQNIQNGIFKIDLHSHSNHSDGWGSIKKILDEVAKYSDEFNLKTGEKFTFALTDHDKISGVKEALEYINLNKDKFKNVNFIPGVELSFSFVADNKIKTGEMLAYFINPNTKEMDILVNNLNENRNKMIDNCIKLLGQGFSRNETENYFINKDGETFAYNLHYRLRNYAQIKARVVKIAKEKNQNPNELYKKLMDKYVFKYNSRVPKPFVCPDGFDEFLKIENISTSSEKIDEKIDEICKKFYPKIINGKVVSNTENSFEKIIDTIKNDKNIVLSFAHPYFTFCDVKDYKKEITKMLNYSKGKIRMSENYHQAYSDKIPKEKIEEINAYMTSKNLIPIGGRDNHKSNFLN